MSSNSSFEYRNYALRPISILFTITLTLISMILGSVMAVVLSWVWLASMATAWVIGSLRMRSRPVKTGVSPKSPVTIEGVYKTIDGMSQPKGSS